MSKLPSLNSENLNKISSKIGYNKLMNQIISNKKGFIQILEVSKFLKCPNLNENNGNDFLFQKHKNFIRTKSKFTYRHTNNIFGNNNKNTIEKNNKNHICDLLIKPKSIQRYASQNPANRFTKNDKNDSLPDTIKTNSNPHLNTNNNYLHNSTEKPKKNDIRNMIILNSTVEVKNVQFNNTNKSNDNEEIQKLIKMNNEFLNNMSSNENNNNTNNNFNSNIKSHNIKQIIN